MNLIPSNSALYESPATPWETSGDARDARNTQLRANPREDPIAAILKVLRQGKRFLVCSHSWPDGDAVGSMIAIGMLLEQMGKHVDLVTADRIPANCRSLPGVEAIRSQVRVKGTYDAAILLECDGLARAKLPGLEDFFLINIDHHVSGRAFAHLNWIDPDATSVGELIYKLVKAAGATVTPQMATCLYATVLTDTAGFCFGSIQASTFDLARNLALAGADPIRIAQDVCFSTSTARSAASIAAVTSASVAVWPSPSTNWWRCGAVTVNGVPVPSTSSLPMCSGRRCGAAAMRSSSAWRTAPRSGDPCR